MSFQSLCRFAVARADITPPVGIYHRMWGAAAHDRAEGVHRGLTATALLLQSVDGGSGPESLQLFVALDHCVLATAEIEGLVEAIQRESDIPRQCVVIAFSHTHAAGLMNEDRVPLPGGELIPQYMQGLRQTVGRLALEARKNLQPATISYGTGRCDLAAHRDYWDEATAQWVCGYNPEGEADDTLLVARFTDLADKPLCTLVNYACHPTTLAWDNRQISPDYPGALRELVEQETKVPCVFLQGAAGDLGPKEGFVGDVSVADRNGRQLGHAALAALEALPPPGTRFVYSGPVVSGATIGTWEHRKLSDEERQPHRRWRIERLAVPLPYRAGLPQPAEVERRRAELQRQEQAAREAGDSRAAADWRALVERQTRLLSRVGGLPAGDHYPLQVILGRIGDAIWVATQGEPYSVLQRTLRQRFAPRPVLVTTIINHWGASYLPPADLYDKGIYQESIAVLAAGSLERLTEEISTRIEAMLKDG